MHHLYKVVIRQPDNSVLDPNSRTDKIGHSLIQEEVQLQYLRLTENTQKNQVRIIDNNRRTFCKQMCNSTG